MEKIYKGKIEVRNFGDSDDVLFISTINDPLAEELEWICGKEITVKYWISSVELTTEQAKMGFLNKLYGAGEADYEARYSELTGYLWTDEELTVGGHDLLDILKQSDGEYIILEIHDNARPPN